ncbi:hypothetical protein BBJ28_00010781 [Nothophytophthora sp. Chile5]|nr:hypothetical protein BBJ28_00010781 [Nothophytophthora sp. Chile5]
MGGVARVTPHRETVKGVATSIGWPRPRKSGNRPGQQKKRITGPQLFNLVRRLVGVAAAFVYAGVGLQSTYITVDVLQGTAVGTQAFAGMEAELIAGYAGEGLIRDSPLVQAVLGGDTTPRNQTLFLESATATSFENCSSVELFDSGIYSDMFLRDGFLNLVATGSYNLSILHDLEFVLPVVDCSSPPLVHADPSLLRVFNLVRRKSDPQNVQIIAISLSIQDYRIDEQTRVGPTLLATLFGVSDMSASTVEQHFMLALDYPYTRDPVFNVYTLNGVSSNGFWEFSSIPRNATADPVLHVRTSRRRGFYLNAESEQSNIRNLFWTLELESPPHALSLWDWRGEPVILDSWAWVHGIHLIFAWQTLFSLGVLGLVVFRNLTAGKVWVGDAFASVSNGTLMLRGALVLASWHVNEYWTLVEFCISNANDISGTQRIPIHPELVHADMLVMFLSVIGLIGRITKERIDPAFALFLFEIIHTSRQSMMRSMSSVMKAIVDYSDVEYRAGIASVNSLQEEMSPMRLWTTDSISNIDFSFLLASFYPQFVLLFIVLVYVALRKLYHRVFPESVGAGTSGKSSADRSVNEKAALAQKGNLTNFELSTGAELEARYGLISDYKNYVFFKGLKFASADGVYCSGYVIANGKFLVASKDLLTIAIIKALRVRFTNVYVYDVDGSSVQRTARLVYPNTLAWQDLLFLNINVLA